MAALGRRSAAGRHRPRCPRAAAVAAACGSLMLLEVLLCRVPAASWVAAGPARRAAETESATARAAELRAGDLGENAGESFFPLTAEQTIEATGEVLPSEPAIRIGHGYDIHKMLPRDNAEGWGKCAPQPAVIGGVTFGDFELGVVAHSDGDVIYHSTTDAVLGALGLPDIGQLFPDNDPRWRGANSEQFFAEAVRLMNLRGYRLANVDVTIIAEKPRLAARKEEMKANIVRICKTIPARVNIKARTHEGVDSVGECRALECHVCILLERC
ncbi:unnamed protein product [Polarella glacialis]|uniref:2-C-methyl-D-erythritol 2,4-cyclodiphosphate synthase n=1 Tax=Polarella glacialis TaxID=89957 RepID=A0A813HU60_POLGL|nr:unnamed protein product [Polarella glacialis]CAE8735739.1 unnamed protein product [Polarella glacialis]